MGRRRKVQQGGQHCPGQARERERERERGYSLSFRKR